MGKLSACYAERVSGDFMILTCMIEYLANPTSFSG